MLVRQLIVGSRSSGLALVQWEELMARLRDILPDLELVLVRIGAQGDVHHRSRNSRTGGRGSSARSLEEALLSGVIDVAVQSLRDVPSELAPGLRLAAVPRRRDPRDALISASGKTLEQLPAGSRIGTVSQRRALQLKAIRCDLEACSIRGAVETRVKKVRHGELDGLIISAAAAERMGWQDRVAEYLPVEAFLPAACQGALGLEVTVGNTAGVMMALVNDEASWQATAAERTFLRTLGDGCRSAAAALAHVEDGVLRLEGMVSGSISGKIIRAQRRGLPRAPEELGRSVAERILEAGGMELVEESRLLATW